MNMTFGFLGLGDMGLPMARRLLATGRPLVVWNRSRAKAQTLAAEGAIVADTPAEVAAQADCVGMCLTSHQTVADITWGEKGLLTSSNSPRAKVVIDFSTGAPEAAREFALRAQRQGVAWLDAPVSGGVPAAEAGSLIVFAGGTEQALTLAKPMLEQVAARTSHMGPSGSGQTTKVCNQMIVATNVLAIAETIALARRAGVAVERLPAALKGGFADSTPFQIFGPRMARHEFEPRLGAISLMGKDAGLAAALAQEFHAHTPLLDAVRAIYAQVESTPGLDTAEDLSKVIGLFEDLHSGTP